MTNFLWLVYRLRMKFPDQVEYGETFKDDTYQYRNVILNEPLYERVKERQEKGQLLEQDEWLCLGLQMGLDW